MRSVETISFNDAGDLRNGDGGINKPDQRNVSEVRDEQEEKYLFDDAQHGILFGDRNVLKIIFVAKGDCFFVDPSKHKSGECNSA
jgi:hypothetical protein